MVSVPEATSIILSRLFSPHKQKVPVIQAVGRILAEPLNADRDLPPFDRVTMDGIAISSQQSLTGAHHFTVKGVQAAGQPRMKLSDSGGCIEVMTGAMLPEGTDTVIRYEDIEIKDGIALIKLGKIAKGENIHFQGLDARGNETLLSPGIRVSPAEVSLMASVGRSEIEVFEFPRTAIISTGDEIVAIDQSPLPYQIRRSNGYALQAALRELECEATQFHILDQKDALEKSISAILESHKLVILSGGVSKGKFDYVPQALESLGIKKLFHQVTQKPGKPFWFGVSDKHTIFALPGNPVSTYMCFYRYIKPWLMKSMGLDHPFPSAVLATDFTFIPALTYFLQARIQQENGRWMAHPDPGGGSGDFANLKEVDGFLELPAERSEFETGEILQFIPFRN